MNDFSEYLKRLLQEQPGALTKEEETVLIQRTQKGDEDAYSDLLSHNLKLVASVAAGYFSDTLEPDDLFQEGCIGFRTAVDKFDFSYDCRLSTYAVRWVSQAISRMIQEQGRTIRIPEHMQTDKNRIRRAEEDFFIQNGVKPTEEELAEVLNMKVEKIREVKRTFSSIDSLDREIADDSDSCLQDFVESEAADNPEMMMVHQDMMENLKKGIESVLTPREQLVIQRRYGLNDLEIATLDEIGKDLGLTRERVRQIEKQALSKLYMYSPLKAA